MNAGNTYKVTLSPVGDYSFKEEIYYTTSSSTNKACFNIYHKHQSVKSTVKRDLGVLKAEVCNKHNQIKNTQNNIEEFLEMNYEDILLYERNNIII